MTRLIFLILFILVACTAFNKSFGQKAKVFVVQGDTVNLAKDTIIRNKLIGLNLHQFKGKSVEQLLKNDTVKQYKKYWFSDEPPLKLSSLNLTFARGLYLAIYFDTLKYQTRFSKNGKFNFDKILKETISDIQLDKDFFDENVVKRYSNFK